MLERPPDVEPQFMPVLAQAWFEANGRDDDKPTAVPGSRVRASEAGMCARMVAYSIERRDVLKHLAGLDLGSIDAEEGDAEAWRERLANTDPTNPPTIADAWRMGLGSMVHDRLEDAMKSAFPNAEVEVKVSFEDYVDGSGAVDIVVTEQRSEMRHSSDGDGIAVVPFVTVIEVKTINGWGFKKSTGAQGDPEGPKQGHVLQAAMSAVALDADRVVVGYLAMELLSPAAAKRAGVDEIGRFTAEWSFDRDEFEPMAKAEFARQAKILTILDAKGPAAVPRSIPSLPIGALITQPKTGLWSVTTDGKITNSGTTWQCDYCRYRDRCISDG